MSASSAEQRPRGGGLDIAVLHYHLDAGGVTGAIAGHLAALREAGAREQGVRVALFHGAARAATGLPGAEGFDLPVLEVRGLGYDDGRLPEPEELAGELRSALASLDFSPGRTVIHAHNHSLGRNLSLPGALHRLARDGYALLLQIHDFAEDFRPAAYRRLLETLGEGSPSRLADVLYPQGPAVHYATLTRRDRAIVERSGVAASRLYGLPNVVRGLGRRPAREAARAKLAAHGVDPQSLFLLYPVRGIRRKNLGEALLWAALAPPGGCVGLTLPPRTTAERRAYLRWKALSVELELPCLFELGAAGGLKIEEGMAAADRILTTSVAEGFGLVFLEAACARRSLVGRDLPEVTADLKDCGLRFPWLEPSLWVPVDWVGGEAFRVRFAAAYRAALAAYGRAAPPDRELTSEIDRLVVDGRVDFARLDTELQRRVLEAAPSGRTARQLLALNPGIARALTTRPSGEPATLEANARAVRRHYSPAACGRRLLRLYREVAASPRRGLLRPPRGRAILDQQLALSRFHPLRTEQ